ncbi:outer membrane protein assembly factor BamD [Ferrovibrio xuzhouensis]|uniref:Outer membrane protein assembly factor BamD n=1 Tax=Ferrovibrio xuzhouensis TaxID=1576914 RepID=A0ABV7VL89_9PROT
MPKLATPDSPAAVNNFRRAAAAILLTVVLAACGKTEAPYVERPVEDLYNGAMNAVAAYNWEAAAKGFDEVERQHPYSVWATKAEIMGAYAYYQQNKYTDAVSAAQRFLQLHPGNKDAPYAYYLIAICYYEQITDVGRDQKITQQALDALQEVVRRYPTSEYARDARLKIDLTNDHLAGKEMAIGRYYLHQGLYIAAINRFRTVIEKYQTTTQVPEALHRLTEAYLSLGVLDEAQNVAAVLGYNYPGSEWYADTYSLLTGQKVASSDEQKQKEGWIGRTWHSVF